MTSLADVLAKRAITKRITLELPHIIDPETNKPFKLSFRVPSLAEYADFVAPIRAKHASLYLATAIVAEYMEDPEKVLTSAQVEDACTTSTTDVYMMDKVDIIGRILRIPEIGTIADAIDNAVTCGFGREEKKTPDELIEDNVKN